MIKRVTILFAAVSCLIALPLAAAAAEYAHTITVEDMSFSWTVDGDNLNVQLSAKTDSWVGIGFNPSEAMKDAGFVIGYVKGGTVTVTDHFGTGRYQHMEDEKLGGTDNVSNVSGSESGGVTTLAFTIPLNSGDAKDPAISPSGDTTVLLAYGSGRDSFRSKHTFRTSLTVNLSTGAHR